METLRILLGLGLAVLVLVVVVKVISKVLSAIAEWQDNGVLGGIVIVLWLLVALGLVGYGIVTNTPAPAAIGFVLIVVPAFMAWLNR